MSNATTETIEIIEKELQAAFAEAPVLVRINPMFKNLTGVTFQMLEVLKSQQAQLNDLRQALYETQGQVDDLEAQQ